MHGEVLSNLYGNLPESSMNLLRRLFTTAANILSKQLNIINNEIVHYNLRMHAYTFSIVYYVTCYTS